MSVLGASAKEMQVEHKVRGVVMLRILYLGFILFLIVCMPLCVCVRACMCVCVDTLRSQKMASESLELEL